MSVDSLWPSIFTLVGVAFGTTTTYMVSARQARSGERIARAQIESQQQLAREQSRSQIELERERHRRERLEEAYSQLMMWCADLDRLINDVEDAFFTSDKEKIEIAHGYTKEWPFTITKEPKEVAGFRHYWSEEIYMLLREFRGMSLNFSTPAYRILDARVSGADLEGDEKDSAIMEFMRSSEDLVGVLEEIRRVAHRDVCAAVEER